MKAVWGGQIWMWWPSWRMRYSSWRRAAISHDQLTCTFVIVTVPTTSLLCWPWHDFAFLCQLSECCVVSTGNYRGSYNSFVPRCPDNRSCDCIVWSLELHLTQNASRGWEVYWDKSRFFSYRVERKTWLFYMKKTIENPNSFIFHIGNTTL